jgi:hypothetical protein
MWELPGVPVDIGDVPETVALGLAGTWARNSRLVSRLARLDHAFTHRRVVYLPFLFRVEGRSTGGVGGSPRECDGATFRWARLRSEVKAMPLPAAQRRIVDAAFGPNQ